MKSYTDLQKMAYRKDSLYTCSVYYEADKEYYTEYIENNGCGGKAYVFAKRSPVI